MTFFTKIRIFIVQNERKKMEFNITSLPKTNPGESQKRMSFSKSYDKIPNTKNIGNISFLQNKQLMKNFIKKSKRK